MSLLLVVMPGGLEGAAGEEGGKKNLENNQKAVQVEMSFPTLHAAAAFD